MIEARALTKRYGKKLAVDQLSFTVRPGVVTGFLGPNGSGKSTTMRVIMGLDNPQSGTATVNGRNFRDLNWPLREVGALLEARAIHSGRSARNHLLMLAATNRIPRTRVDEMLELVGLTGVGGKRAGKFSLGMGQRLGIAAALLGDPAVVLFDEPVNGLDPDGIRWVRNLLRGLAKEGRTVFVSSHLMSEMALTADDVVVIGRGRLIAQMPVSELTAKSAGASVTVRSPSAAQLHVALEGVGASVFVEPDGALSVRDLAAPAIGDVAARCGLTLHELAPHAASLEEAFMELTEDSIDYRGELGFVSASDGGSR
jgi:ABC-2 type transport system ATP-binding protein